MRVAGQPQESRPHPQFAFWYETWRGAETASKIDHATTVIGLAPSEVKSAHDNGFRVLRYLTYYQSRLNEKFLHDQQDLAEAGFWNGTEYLRSVFNPERYVLCDNSLVTRQRVRAYVERMLAEQEYDGVFLDNTVLEPAAHGICQATHKHWDSSANGAKAFLSLLAETREIVKLRPASALVIANPGNPEWADKLGTDPASLWELSDYVVWESYGYTSYRGDQHDRWEQTLAQSFALAKSKRAKILAVSYPLDPQEALFSFAIARIFDFEWTANLGENQQRTKETGGHFGAFLAGLPWELGAPTGPMPGNRNSDRLTRTFEHGQAVVNIGTTPISVSIPAGTQLYADGRITKITGANQMTLGSRAAAIFLALPISK